MGYSESFLPHFSEFCNEKFGEIQGAEIFVTAEKRLGDLIGEADYKNNKYIKIHMDKNMLPVIAIKMKYILIWRVAFTK